MAGMAAIHLQEDGITKALPMAYEALHLFQSHDARLEVRNTKRLLAEIYEKSGDYKQAMDYYKQTDELADSLFNENMTRRLATVQFEYDEEKRLTEIVALKKEKEMLGRQSRYQILSIIGLVTLLATGSLLLFLVGRNARQRKRINTVLQAKNTEIETQARELKELDTYKSKVLSVVGHDLRGPLGGIKAVFDLLETKQMQAEDFYKLSGSIKESVDEMYTTTDNLLHWANTQMKRVTVEPEVFEPRAEAEHTIKLLHTIAGYKEIALYNEIPQSLRVLADKSHFAIILRNLVSNAIKFTRAKGYIEILAQVKNGFIEFAVKDNGVGIEPAILQSLHSSAEQSFSKEGLDGEKGTGLGLKLCRDFTELNGGTFWIESELNTGTNIHFTLKNAPGKSFQVQQD
jgi:two-component system, sensor histidine kinase and response regulator